MQKYYTVRFSILLFLILIYVKNGKFSVLRKKFGKGKLPTIDHQNEFYESKETESFVIPVKVSKNGNFISHNVNHELYLSPRKFNSSEDTKRARDSLPKKKRKKRSTRKTHVPYGGRLTTVLYYSLELEGRHILIELTPNTAFIAPHGVFQESTSLRKDGYAASTITSGPFCYFSGRVVNDTLSSVVLSTCNGLMGFIRTGGREYIVEPIKSNNSGRNELQRHQVYLRSTVQANHLITGNHSHKGKKSLTSGNLSRKVFRRPRRSVSIERYVETLVVADQEMTKFYAKEDLKTYILTVMNMVSKIYRDPSLGNAVNIVVVRIMLLDNPEIQKELNTSHNAEETLASFCKWQESINPKDEGHLYHHDLAILLTRHNICSRENTLCTTLGLSEIGGMCQKKRSCNVNEDTGLQIAYTVAHEIGHNFDMDHDGQLNVCKDDDVESGATHVMAAHLSVSSSHFTWSKCSREKITQFLDRRGGHCLKDKPEDLEFDYPVLPPGAMYDADHQCRLAFGPEAEYCGGVDDKCQTLWCRVGPRCVTRFEPAAEGTQCDKHKWCYYGKCIYMGEELVVIHGNWGPWSSWSGCSRSCGAGVQVSTRECNNPFPSNGGKYCTGDRRKYRICNTEPCPASSSSYRAVQCAEYNNRTYKGIQSFWNPVIIKGQECQLHCKPDNKFYTIVLKDVVADGTSCKPGTKNMCIEGACKHVACDWTIDGKAQEDRCGMCHGDGTQCVTKKGVYNESNSQGYVEIVTLPEGSLNVKVKELEGAPNYIAIKDNETNFYYLNGNWVIQWSGEYSIAGLIMHYRRQFEQETLFLPGPLKQSLVLMALLLARNPGIEWEYTVPHLNASYTPEFHWNYTDWSVCSKTCGSGVQILEARCMENEAGLVEERYCNDSSKPAAKRRSCNDQVCPSGWWTGPWQPCSVTCGPKGLRKRTVICVRSYGQTEKMALLDTDCFPVVKPHDLEPCPDQEPCPVIGQWLTGEWNHSCDDDPCGSKKREIVCVPLNATCKLDRKPSTEELCLDVACGNWSTGNWSKCSSSCGSGVQTREVRCVGSSICSPLDEPGTEQSCNIKACPRPSSSPSSKKLITYSTITENIFTHNFNLSVVNYEYHYLDISEENLLNSSISEIDLENDSEELPETNVFDSNDVIEESFINDFDVTDPRPNKTNIDIKIINEDLHTNESIISSSKNSTQPSITSDLGVENEGINISSSSDFTEKEIDNNSESNIDFDISMWTFNDYKLTPDDYYETDPTNTDLGSNETSDFEKNISPNISKLFDYEEQDFVNITLDISDDDTISISNILNRSISESNEEKNKNVTDILNYNKQVNNISLNLFDETLNNDSNNTAKENNALTQNTTDKGDRISTESSDFYTDIHINSSFDTTFNDSEFGEGFEISLSQEIEDQEEEIFSILNETDILILEFDDNATKPTNLTDDVSNNTIKTPVTEIFWNSTINSNKKKENKEFTTMEPENYDEFHTESIYVIKNPTNYTTDNFDDISLDNFESNEDDFLEILVSETAEENSSDDDQFKLSESDVTDVTTEGIKSLFFNLSSKIDIHNSENFTLLTDDTIYQTEPIFDEIEIDSDDIFNDYLLENESSNATQSSSFNENINIILHNKSSNDLFLVKLFNISVEITNENKTLIDFIDLIIHGQYSHESTIKESIISYLNQQFPSFMDKRFQTYPLNYTIEHYNTTGDLILTLEKIKNNSKSDIENNKLQILKLDEEIIKSASKVESKIFSSNSSEWVIGKWSECSEPCGIGEQTRALECHSVTTGLLLHPNDCEGEPPLDFQHCNQFECLNWTTSPFGPCSSLCGPGVRERNVSCPEHGKCHDTSKPSSTEECFDQSCSQWSEGPWSMCTKTCGGGYQIRLVKCIDIHTLEQAEYCEGDRPVHKRSCNEKTCPLINGNGRNVCRDTMEKTLCNRLRRMCSMALVRRQCCVTCSSNTRKFG